MRRHKRICRLESNRNAVKKNPKGRHSVVAKDDDKAKENSFDAKPWKVPEEEIDDRIEREAVEGVEDEDAVCPDCGAPLVHKVVSDNRMGVGQTYDYGLLRELSEESLGEESQICKAFTETEAANISRAFGSRFLSGFLANL